MKTQISHKHRSIIDFEELLNSYTSKDLASPYRSTVPLLSYWRNLNEIVGEYAQLLKLDLKEPLHFCFEYTVPVVQGRGNASHTDLMIISGNHAIAIEAKYTEPSYETVQKWLDKPSAENRRLVLNGWLSLIEKATGKNLSIDDVRGCTYQLIHRSASVCSIKADKRSVVYMLFDPSGGQIEDCRLQLKRISKLVGISNDLDFRMMLIELKKAPRYLLLQASWNSGDRDLSVSVREGILSGELMKFGGQRVEKFN